MPDNRGLLTYKIDCTSDKSNFVVNTLLRNSGVTKADRTAITATDLVGKTSGAALQIKGGENFFREKNGRDLVRFSLSADAELVSDLATEMMKLDYENVNGAKSANYTKFYDSSTSYKGKLSNDSFTITVDDLKELKSEAERLIPIAENCVTALGDKASSDLKTLLDYAKKFNNSVTLNAEGTGFDLSLQVPDGIDSTVSDTDLNKGRLLFAAIDSATNAVQNAVYVAVSNSSKLAEIRASADYEQIAAKYDELKAGNESNYAAGQSAYDTMKAETLSAGDTGYTAEDITALVSADSSTVSDDFSYGAINKVYYGNSLYFKWFTWYKYAEVGGFNISLVVSNNWSGKVNCFKDDSNLKNNFCFMPAAFPGYSYLQNLGDEVASLLKSVLTADLALHTTTPTTAAQTVQDGNTYQIFETTDQKLYWDSDKLVFEIPIELPEKTTDNSTITGFKLTCEENPEYLAVATATE